MSWQPPQLPADGPPPAPPPEAPARRRTRLGLFVRLAAVVAIAATLFVATRDSNDGRSGTTRDGTTTATIGPGGGRVVIPQSDAAGAGITLEVPEGALSTSTPLTLSASPGQIGRAHV